MKRVTLTYLISGSKHTNIKVSVDFIPWYGILGTMQLI